MSKLDRAWVNCLRMWKWIAEVHGKGGDFPRWTVDQLKIKWLKDNRFTQDIAQNCFFCHYTGPYKFGSFDCEKCPGRLVNIRFDCANKTYHFDDKPKAFYKKLLELNKKRLSA